MTELRTLKDLGCAVTSDNLRDEAINWIKKWKEQLSEGIWIKVETRKPFGNCFLVYESDNIKTIIDSALISRISSFVYFFNITKEDLIEVEKHQ